MMVNAFEFVTYGYITYCKNCLSKKQAKRLNKEFVFIPEFNERRFVGCSCLSNMLRKDYDDFIAPARHKIASAIINQYRR